MLDDARIDCVHRQNTFRPLDSPDVLLRTPASIVAIPVPLEIVVDESNEAGDPVGSRCALSHRITIHWSAGAGKKLAIS